MHSSPPSSWSPQVQLVVRSQWNLPHVSPPNWINPNLNYFSRLSDYNGSIPVPQVLSLSLSFVFVLVSGSVNFLLCHNLIITPVCHAYLYGGILSLWFVWLCMWVLCKWSFLPPRFTLFHQYTHTHTLVAITTHSHRCTLSTLYHIQLFILFVNINMWNDWNGVLHDIIT